MMELFTTIISTEELAEILPQPGVILVDCRFDISDPEWGEYEYRQLHIPGAVYAHLEKDLSGPRTPSTGRHPLPSPEDAIKAFSNLGIGNESQVIVYDATSGSFAARLWFMLNWLGHSRVAILDGGFPKWHAEGRSIVDGIDHNPYAEFTGKPNSNLVITTEEMEKLQTDPSWKIIDARAPERYSGEFELIDPIAGHIPNAVNRFHGLNITSSGTFHTPQELRNEFTTLIGNTNPDKVVVYCGSGVTSCHHLVAMKIAGIQPAKLYAGSWSEWIRDPSHPIHQTKIP